ncbi:MAG TPA: AraC family transcriptional regulator [Burkholderiaceae bacterium]|nr:AraC family transcriptional regulator [Burkholderiaceae bacterium]
MACRDSRGEYTKRMHRVLEYVDRHLDQPLELSELAGVANFSPFHFHRLFSAWMGETLGDYLRRRRLELAAMRLAAQPRLPVINVALSVGFGSSEAFTRAFKARFGSAPTRWRQHQARQRGNQRIPGRGTLDGSDRKPGQASSKPDQAPGSASSDDGTFHHALTEVPMKVKIIDRPAVRVAYLRHVGPYGQPLSAFWQQVVYPWLATNDLLDQPRYGISHDDPGITAPEKCRYDACVEAPASFVATGATLMTTIPGGKYAATHFRGTPLEIGQTWSALLRDWLPSSGMQLDARPCFEYYPRDGQYDAGSGAFSCDIVIPVVPL